jgi:glutaredoxin 3
MSNVKVLVDTKIAGKKVMVFSKSYCPYCTKAKQVFKKHLGKDLSEEDYEVMEIENNPNCDAIQNYLKKLTGERSVSIYAYITFLSRE